MTSIERPSFAERLKSMRSGAEAPSDPDPRGGADPRAAFRRVAAEEAAETTDAITEAVLKSARQLGETRRDALTAVARAMQRAGGDPANWSAHAAMTAWNIAEQLAAVVREEPDYPDPAYADNFDARKVAQAVRVEAAIRTSAGVPMPGVEQAP